MNRNIYTHFSIFIFSLYFFSSFLNTNPTNSPSAIPLNDGIETTFAGGDSSIIEFLETALPDTFYCVGDTLVLYAYYAGADYEWSTSVITPFIEVWTPGIYWVDMTVNDCVYRDSFYVAGIENCNEPFLCDGKFYMSISSEASTNLYTLEVGNTVTFNQIASTAINYNGISFRASDRFIYAKEPFAHTFFRISIGGYVKNMGQLPGLADGDWYIAADFSPEDYYVVTSNDGGDKIAVYDISGLDPVLVEINNKTYTDDFSGVPNFGDIAFHPETGICYGYDHTTFRLCTIDHFTGEVTAFGNQQSSEIDAIGALFFNAKGELFAYGQDEFFSINLTTGAFTLLTNGPMSSTLDGCSCPFNVMLTKKIESPNVCAGEPLVYTFQVLNNTGQTQYDISFRDSLPGSLTFSRDPYNLLKGEITGGTAIGSNLLEITGMRIPPGYSNFYVEVLVPDENPSQIIFNQASMMGFDTFLPYRIVSDDPDTYHFEDPTSTNFWNNAVVLSTTFEDSTIIIEYGDSILIEPLFNFTPDTLFWKDWSGLSLLDCVWPCEALLLKPTNTAEYAITAVDIHGCSATAHTRVEVDNHVALYIPNAFSPNGDGINDIFTIYAKEGKMHIRDFQIFSRWGGMVFQATDFPPNSGVGWDGRLRGTEMNTNVFVWMAEVEYLDGRVEILRGDVTLIK